LTSRTFANAGWFIVESCSTRSLSAPSNPAVRENSGLNRSSSSVGAPLLSNMSSRSPSPSESPGAYQLASRASARFSAGSGFGSEISGVLLGGSGSDVRSKIVRAERFIQM